MNDPDIRQQLSEVIQSQLDGGEFPEEQFQAVMSDMRRLARLFDEARERDRTELTEDGGPS